MGSMNDWSIKAKVTGAFALVLVVAVGLGLFAVERLGAVNDQAADIRNNWLPSTRLLGEFAHQMASHRASVATLLLAASDEAMEKQHAALMKTQAARDTAWRTYQPLIAPGEERRIADEIARMSADYAPQIEQILGLARNHQKEKAIALYVGPSRDQYQKIRALLLEDIELNAREGVKAADRGAQVYASARFSILAALELAAALCAAAGYVIGQRRLEADAAHDGTAMGKLAAHDLSVGDRRRRSQGRDRPDGGCRPGIQGQHDRRPMRSLPSSAPSRGARSSGRRRSRAISPSSSARCARRSRPWLGRDRDARHRHQHVGYRRGDAAPGRHGGLGGGGDLGQCADGGGVVGGDVGSIAEISRQVSQASAVAGRRWSRRSAPTARSIRWRKRRRRSARWCS